MITAEQAAEQAEEAVYKDVANAIDKASLGGNFSTALIVPKLMVNDLVAYLMSKGFRANMGNYDYLYIYWD